MSVSVIPRGLVAVAPRANELIIDRFLPPRCLMSNANFSNRLTEFNK